MKRLVAVAALAGVAASCVNPARGGSGSGSGGAQSSEAVDDLASRFQYRVPLEIGKTWSAGADRLTITEIWGTRPRVEVGGCYLVRGTCELASADSGEVFFHVKGPSNVGGDLDVQKAAVRRGRGTFSVMHTLTKDGFCHVSLFTRNGSDYVPAADVYFGSGANVLREEK